MYATFIVESLNIGYEIMDSVADLTMGLHGMLAGEGYNNQGTSHRSGEYSSHYSAPSLLRGRGRRAQYVEFRVRCMEAIVRFN